LVLLNSVRLASLKERFNRESDSLYLDAKRAIVSSNSAVPPWFIVMTVALGWNEFMAILRNPLLTMMLLMVLGATYLIWYTNMGGPVLQVVKVSTQEFGRQVNDQLKERGFDAIKIKQQVSTKIAALLHPNNDADEIPMETLK
jgi:protein SEY1